MPEITLAEVKAAEQSPKFRALYKRQDTDMSMWYLEQYTMKDKNNNPVPNVVNVTLNEPATYADRSVALLGAAKRKIELTGIEAQEQHKIETYIKQALINNDEMLSWQLIEDLKFAMDWYSCMRGWIANRTLVLTDSGTEVIEVMPLDTRWMAWQADRKGLVWTSNRLQMRKDEAEEAYKPIKTTITGPAGEIKDIVEVWTRDYFRAYIGAQEGGTWPHTFGEVPVDILPVRTKPYTLDPVSQTRGFSSQGEGIYRANRELFPKACELASIWATMNKMQFMAPLQFSSASGRKLSQRPYGYGIVVNLKQNEKLLEIPIKELTASGQNLFGQFMGWLQRGGLTHVEYGELSFELSAVAISRLSEAKDQIFKPRLSTESMAYQRIIKMIRHQHIKGGYKTTLDDKAKEMALKPPKELNKVFSVNVEFHAVYPEQNIANLTVAQAAQNFVSKQTILREYLHVDDPAAELAQLNLEALYKGVPELYLMDTALDLAPVKTMSGKARDAMRSNMIRWKLGKLTEGEVQVPQLKIPQETSQARIRGVESAMPRVPAVHANTETLRRKNVRAKEEGFEANE